MKLASKCGELSDVLFILFEHEIADQLTKAKEGVISNQEVFVQKKYGILWSNRFSEKLQVVFLSKSN